VSAPPVGLAALIAVAGYVTVLGLTELARRRLALDGQVTRRIAHVAGATFSLALPALFDSTVPVLAVGAGFALLLGLTRRRGRLASIHDISRTTWGAELFPVGIAAAFLITDGRAPAYPAAILALAWADPLAAIVGSRWSRHPFRVLGDVRSGEGSLAMVATAAICGAAVASLELPLGDAVLIGSLIGLVAGLVEAVSPRGSDNLTVPVAVAVVVAVGPDGWAIATPVAWFAGLAFILYVGARRRPGESRSRVRPGVTGGTGPGVRE